MIICDPDYCSNPLENWMRRFLRQVWWRIQLAFEWLRERTPWRHANNLSKERPSGWKQSLIGPFFELMWSNAIGTFANFGEARRVQDIDALFVHFLANTSRVKGKGAVSVGLPLLLVIRTHSAFRAGASLAFGGAVPESMAALRLCLETAGYASMMQGDEALSTTWLNRGDDEETRQAARNAFRRHSDVRSALEQRNKTIAGIYQNLYEYLIDGGAHPNERGFMDSLQVEHLEDGGARLIQIYLQADPDVLDRGLRAAAKIGVCALMIFETMYPDEFRELGITQKMPRVREGL
jgi:hypothetical protein